jgi:S-DNA-T family DNA segregation ATPase FtsK/SpoIIIE
MEEKGIVGPYDGRNPRKILLSKEEFLSKDKH